MVARKYPPESAEQNQIAKKLADRGLTIAERRRLAELVTIATTVETPTATNNGGTDRDQALLDLYHWYSDWSATARVLVKRKDHRCSLGIGEKRAKRAATELAVRYGHCCRGRFSCRGSCEQCAIPAFSRLRSDFQASHWG